MRIYVCEDRFEGILCGIYDAWASGLGHANVRVQVRRTQTLELFAEYTEVETDPAKAEKVASSVRRKLSEDIYVNLYKTAMSCAPDKADCMYRYLVRAFAAGPGIVQMYQDPAVMRVFEICRNVGNETHLLLQFIRFRQLPGNVLFAETEPKNYQLTLTAPHFADRLPDENWIIYEKNHGQAAVHEGGKGWFLARMGEEEAGRLRDRAGEDGYEDLWQTFFETIAIEERKNPLCQRGHLPLRYRGTMTEFQREAWNSRRKKERKDEIDVCIGHSRVGDLLPEDGGDLQRGTGGQADPAG